MLLAGGHSQLMTIQGLDHKHSVGVTAVLFQQEPDYILAEGEARYEEGTEYREYKVVPVRV